MELVQPMEDLRLKWAVRLAAVFPALAVVAAVYVKGWATGWPVGSRGAALLALTVIYVAFSHSLAGNKLALLRLGLVAWSTLFAGGIGWAGWYQWKKSKEAPPPAPPSRFVGNDYAGYLENPPEWWAEFAEEFRAAWHLEWDPYLRWKHRPFQGKWIQINSLGQRRTWKAPAMSSKPHRIFAFGGSTMWGNCARDEFTIPSHIARMLHDSGIEAEVINFGESGYVSTQGVIRLLMELRAGNIPAAVIFYDGVNDVFSAFQNRTAGVPQGEEKLREILSGLYERSHRAVNPDRPPVSTGAVKPEPRTDAVLLEETAAVYLGNARLASALGREFGFEAFFYWQPMAYAGKTLTAGETFWVEKNGAKMREFFELAYDRMANETVEGHFRNLSRVFAGVTNQVYVDFCHVTEEANETIAREIAKDLKGLLAAKRNAGAGR